MTKEQREKWEELHDGVLHECLRVTGLLSQLTPISRDYKELMSELNTLTEVANTAGCYLPYLREEPDGVMEGSKILAKAADKTEDYVGVNESDESHVETETFQPKLEPVVTESVGDTEPVETKTLTKEYVRSLLQEKAASGVIVEPFIAKLVPEGKPVKLSSIKVADYGKLVEALNNA